MRLNEEPDAARLWAAQEQELVDSGDVGREFLKALKHVTKTAENYIDRGVDPAYALRRGIAAVESETDQGPLPVALIGPLLVLMGMYWKHGEEMMAGLSPIEHRVAIEALTSKIASLNDAAREGGGDAGELDS